MAGELAPLQSAIPIVANASDRETRYPPSSRIQNQRVFRLDTGNQERWNGSTWLIDFEPAGSSVPPGGGRTVPTVTQYLANNAVFNVLDFNPTPTTVINTGVNDATSAIQAAITAAEAYVPTVGVSSPQSPMVLIPAGIYLTSASLTMNRPILLCGHGPQQTVITGNGVGVPVILVSQVQSQSTYVTYDIRDLGIVGLNTAFATPDGQDGIQVTSSTNDVTVRITNCRIIGCTGSGINVVNDGNSCQIRNTITQSNSYCGILIQSGTTGFNTNFLIDGCFSRQNRIGIYLNGFSSTVRINSGRVTNCLCESNISGTTGTIGSADRPSIGLKMDNCTAVLVHGNYLENNANDLFLASPCFYNKFVYNFWLQSNSWILPGTYGGPPPQQLGIFINNGYGNLFHGNTYGSEPSRPASGVTTTQWGTGTYGDSYAYVTDLLGGEIFRDEIGLYFNDVSDLEPQFAVTNPNGYHIITSYVGIGGRSLGEIQTQPRKIFQFANSEIILNDQARQTEVNSSGTGYVDTIALVPSGATYTRVATDTITPTTFETVNKTGIVSQVFVAGTTPYKRSYATAPPGSGAHLVGEIIFNSAPTANSIFCWVCTTAGTPGTWQQAAYIGPNLSIPGSVSIGGILDSVGAFGCNNAAAQTAAASGGAVVTTAPTQTTPFGFTTSAQAAAIITLLNNIRAALVANGIMS